MKFPHSHATVQSDRLPKIERICAYERWVNGGIIQILSHRIYPIPTAFLVCENHKFSALPKSFITDLSGHLCAKTYFIIRKGENLCL